MLVFLSFGLSLALNIATAFQVWSLDWEIGVGITGWAIASIIISLVLTIVENSVDIRQSIGFIYENTRKA